MPYREIDRSKPTRANQIWHAERLLAEKGRDALLNPHGLIGKECGCGTCFCCAAWYVYRRDVLKLWR